jgi:hypothetical protein
VRAERALSKVQLYSVAHAAFALPSRRCLGYAQGSSVAQKECLLSGRVTTTDPHLHCPAPMKGQERHGISQRRAPGGYTFGGQLSKLWSKPCNIMMPCRWCRNFSGTRRGRSGSVHTKPPRTFQCFFCRPCAVPASLLACRSVLGFRERYSCGGKVWSAQWPPHSLQYHREGAMARRVRH